MSRATSVAVNMLWCVPGEVGGSEEYLLRQLTGLAEIQAPYEITVFVPRGFSAVHSDLAAIHRVIEAPSACRRREIRIVLEHTWLARQVVDSDLVHHGGGIVPSRSHRTSLLTVHDVQYLAYPEYFSAHKLKYLKNRVPSSIVRASAVAVPSAYVAATLVESFGVLWDKIQVVRHGVPDSLGVQATPEAELRKRFDLGNSDVLFMPAVTHPHKNHDFLLQLLATRWTSPNLRLVLAGGQGRAEHAVQQRIADLGIGDRIVRIGRVAPNDRDGLIKMAMALVFPSSYEGFGAPLLEAMKLGTPVIASDQTSIPEVLGGAGLTLPLQLDAWAGALDRLRERRQELIESGKQRAWEFTEAKSGEDLCLAYERAFSRGAHQQ